MSADQPPVLLVHGFATSSARTWGETGWIDLLRDAGRKVLAVDLLGHGEAPKPHDPAEYDVLEERVLDALPDEPVDAVGFSLGARTILVLASSHPERFGRIVVAGVGANLFRRDDSASLLADAVADGGAGAGALGDESPVTQYFRGQAAEAGNDREALAACLRRPNPAPITDEGLARITNPVLVVIGDRDFAGPADPLVERLPDARAVVLRNVDHFATPKDFGFLDAGLEFLGAALG
jgi:pimeloyl-ACP methyl ester carboxylesterase